MSSRNHWLCEKVSAWVLSPEAGELPVQVIEKTLDCIVDNLAAALAGHDALPACAARKVAATTFGKGDSGIWFDGGQLTPAGAAWCNGIAASSLDFDDGHRQARGHPGSAIIPAVLAIVANRPLANHQILAAIAIGYEVATRIARAQKVGPIGTHQSGRWAGFGVVAACGRIIGLSVGQLANAFAIAGVWAPNQLANGSSGYARETGNWAKEGIPVSALQALLAVELARHGFTGPLDVFDHESHYNPEGLVPEGPPSMIQSTYFKRYACCRYIHPALDAWGNLFGDADLDAEQVARIDVSTFSWALKLSNKVCPQSLVDIQFSLPFCLAIRTLLGAGALAVPSEKLLNDRRLVELAARIYLHTSPAFDARFPSETVAEVRVQTLSGAQFYSGEAVSSTPIPRSELEQKFRLAAGDRLSDDHCRKIFTALRADTLNLKGLLSLL